MQLHAFIANSRTTTTAEQHAPRRWSALSRHTFRACLLFITCSAALSHAQVTHGVFRSVDGNGRTIFSDRVSGGQPPAATPVMETVAPAFEPIVLPLVLREAMKNYPVVIHTGNDCKPCDSARSMLEQRGIPFEERTISTVSDHNALLNLSGQDQLPFVTIGKQHLIGWEDGEWQRYLDAAGYPKRSVLPISWQPPPPRPLGTQAESFSSRPAPANVN